MIEKEKKSVLLFFAILLIILGTLTLIYPIFANYLANRERSTASINYHQALEQLTKDELGHKLEQAKRYNELIYKEQQGDLVDFDEIEYQTLINTAGVMGTLDIPALAIETMPFYHGTDFLTLNRGLGHYEASSIPVGGENTRSIITGHSGIQNQVLFTDIIHLQIGDLFFLTILGERLAYQIESFEEVLPTEVNKAKIIPGKDMVTLLTCTPPGINTYRLLVNGVRIPYNEAVNRQVEKRNFWSYQTIVLGSFSVCFTLALLLIVRFRYLVKRFRSEDPFVKEKARKKLLRLYFLTKGLFITLVFSMVALLSVGIYGYTQIQKQQEMAIIDIGQNTELSTFNLPKISKANYSEIDIASVNLSNFSKAKINYQQSINDWSIGKIMIPEVAIDLPILAGMNNDNLMNGVATYTQSQQLGKGNYVLLSHNVFEQNVLLHQIAQLRLNAKIYATDFNELFIYEVSYNDVVVDTEIELLEIKKEAPQTMITLVRCEGDIGTRFRRVVQGNLSSVKSLSTLSATELAQLGLEKKRTDIDGTILADSPVHPINSWSMSVASKIVAEPLQTLIPIVFFLLVPILLFHIV